MSDHDWQAPGGPAPAPNGREATGTASTGDLTPPPLPPDAPAGDGRSAGAPAAPAQPASGQPAHLPPAYPPPAYGQPAYGPLGAYPPPGAGGWTPPPKPGLLPLRPMGFGTLLWAPFRTLRRNPAATFGSGGGITSPVGAVPAASLPFGAGAGPPGACQS